MEATAEQTEYFANIIFIQGHEADEPLRILDNEGPEAAFKYLEQWDHGEYHDIRSEDPKGYNDGTEYINKNGLTYVINYNRPLNYIGMNLVIPGDELYKFSNDV